LELAGAFNECASIDAATRSCHVTMTGLDDSFDLTGSGHHFELFIEVPQFVGPGGYGLGPGALQVEFYDQNLAEWRSVAGGLTVFDKAGRAGSVDATLEPGIENSGAPPLSVSGPWSCG
jgi:hypothetical protein